MATNQNNIQINSFTGGMNTDTSVQALQSDQYIIAKNIRLSQIDSTGNNFGKLKSIEGVLQKNSFNIGFPFKIMAADSIRNYAVVVLQNTTKGSEYQWGVYVISYDNDQFQNITTLFLNTQQNHRLGGSAGVEKVSMVVNYEDDDVVKAYIADGYHSLMVVNISSSTNQDFETITDIKNIESRDNIVLKSPVFSDIVSGNLVSGVVQYSYRLYNKNGIRTNISVPTKLIPIVYSTDGWKNGKNIYGADQGENVGVGFKIKIRYPENSEYLDRIQVFRILYQENGQAPTVDMIYDKKISRTQSQSIIDDADYEYFIDYGYSGISTLTLEEYNQLSDIHIIPKVIESKYDYLFAANIKDQQTYVDDYTQDFDARSYSQNSYQNNNIVLYDYSNNTKIEKNLDQCYEDGVLKDDYKSENGSQLDNILQEIDKKFDCYNIYNDMSKNYTEYYYDGQNSNWNNDGRFCRFNCRDKNNITYGGIGRFVDWKFVIYEITGDYSQLRTDVQKAHTTGNYISLQNESGAHDNFSGNITVGYVSDDGIIKQSNVSSKDWYDSNRNYDGKNYSNPVISYAYKSLKRDELYRYGIILYNRKGDASSVKWIADIRTPSQQIKGFEAFLNGGGNNTNLNHPSLSVRPLGIKFEVNLDKYNYLLQQRSSEIDNWSEDLLIDKYEIVRCNRTASDIKNVSQGVISRPVKKIVNPKAVSETNVSYPYTPTGLMTTANIWSGTDFVAYDYDNADAESDYSECSNYENRTIYQFVSPEVLYQKDYISSTIGNQGYQITPVNYIFNQTADYEPDKYYTLWYGVGAVGGQPAPNYGSALGYSAVEGKWCGSRGRYTQVGNSNFSFPMPPPQQDFPLIIGENNSENHMYGMYMHSLFYPYNYTTSMYHSTFPLNHDFTNENTNTITYSNILADTPVIHTTNVLPINFTKKVYGYSKLYHQATNVFCRVYDDTSDYSYMHIVGKKDECEEVQLSKLSDSYNIYDFKIAEEVSWNELYEDVKTNDNTSTSFKYTDFVTNIGNSQFCNCVCWGTIDNQDYLSGNQIMSDKTMMLGKMSQNNLYNVMVGPGGRTALLQIDDDNIFYKTAASSNIKQWPAGLGLEYWNYYSATNDYQNSVHQQTSDYVDSQQPNPDRNDSDETMYDMIVSKDGARHIFRNSISGTYLCNISHNVTPYGGYGYQDRLLNTYCSYGDLFDKNDSGVVFDGDCFIMPMEYVSQHKYFYSRIKYPVTTCFVYAIPVESSINLAYTYGTEWSRNTNSDNISCLQIEPSDVNGYFTQNSPLYTYNTVYSTNSNADLHSPEVEDSSDNLQNTDYRVYYSNPKSNNESIDQWTVFAPMNYLDVSAEYGSITNLRSFKDSMIFWQDRATGLLSINERAQQIDQSGKNIILGTGGVLSRYDYIDQVCGMSPEKYCDTVSVQSLYWYDDKNKELKQYNNRQFANMNDTYHTDTLLQNTGDDSNPVMFYDVKYSELVSKVLANSDSLTFNERTESFTSIYNVPFDEYVQFGNYTYLLKQDNNKLNIYKWNELTGDRAVDTQNNVLQTYVQFVINQDPLTTKVFDNQEIVTTEMYGYDSYDKSYFNTNHQYTWETDLNYAETDDLQYTDREGNFRFAIPRAVDNSGEEVAYGNRVRGKYMICSITDKQNKYDTSISYVITKFRKSWT